MFQDTLLLWYVLIYGRLSRWFAVVFLIESSLPPTSIKFGHDMLVFNQSAHVSFRHAEAAIGIKRFSHHPSFWVSTTGHDVSETVAWQQGSPGTGLDGWNFEAKPDVFGGSKKQIGTRCVQIILCHFRDTTEIWNNCLFKFAWMGATAFVLRLPISVCWRPWLGRLVLLVTLSLIASGTVQARGRLIVVRFGFRAIILVIWMNKTIIPIGMRSFGVRPILLAHADWWFSICIAFRDNPDLWRWLSLAIGTSCTSATQTKDYCFHGPLDLWKGSKHFVKVFPCPLWSLECIPGFLDRVSVSTFEAESLRLNVTDAKMNVAALQRVYLGSTHHLPGYTLARFISAGKLRASSRISKLSIF